MDRKLLALELAAIADALWSSEPIAQRAERRTAVLSPEAQRQLRLLHIG